MDEGTADDQRGERVGGGAPGAVARREGEREQGQEGIVQPYGIYFPQSYDPQKATPLQLWLHWRGGTAHSAGAAIPGMFRDLGDRPDAVVVSPRGRGSSSWYVGKGHVDVEQVWADVHALVDVDASRRYVSGHSMGGWGSFLMTITHPDWFAAALPASPPVTQGAWTGLDFPTKRLLNSPRTRSQCTRIRHSRCAASGSYAVWVSSSSKGIATSTSCGFA